MTPKLESYVCILGYVVVSAYITDFMEAGLLARIIGVLGVIPIAEFCAKADYNERRPP